MYSFQCDYSEGAHPLIIEKLVQTNYIQMPGYTKDDYTAQAVQLLKDKMNCQSADIHFLVGGTQTNTIALAAFLRPHQAVISADTGHVATLETGAIEATGHKVITCPSVNGKLTVDYVDKVVKNHKNEHMVMPKVVYISNPTEIGTVYTKEELMELSEYCKDHSMYFYIDGARLGSALVAEDNNMKLSDYPTLCDAFYIGGTKNGALFGEALVLLEESVKEEFRYIMKQRGALMAKGRLLGLQFQALFENDLFYELADHANKISVKLRDGINECGYTFLGHSTTNQQFPILPSTVIEKLEKEFVFTDWSEFDSEHRVIRLVTSWATKEDEVDRFIAYLKQI